MLLRSMGIPARYVEGMYVSKDELAAVKKGKELEVPDEDAHAWVEVFDEKYGFVNCGKAMEYYESTGKTEFIYYEYVV